MKFTRRYYSLQNKNLSYVYNASQVDKIGRKQARKKLGIANEIVISYCGGVTLAREVHNIVDGFLISAKPNMTLYIVGNSDMDASREINEILEKHAEKSSQVVLVGQVDNSELKNYMEASDLTFALYAGNSLNNRYSSPNKLFDAVALGTAIFASPSPLVRRIINTYRVGALLQDPSPLSISAAIDNFFVTDAQGNFQLANEKEGWECQKEKLIHLFERFYCDGNKVR